jgi:carboxymethylenebutenolidase
VNEALSAQAITIEGFGGDPVEAYLALPDADGPRGGVVVIHHMPGFDSATKEITRRFAAIGYSAICPNLHYREAPDAAPDDAAAASRAQGGVPDERLVGDVDAAASYLRSVPNSNGKIGVIGYCSGGRQAFLAACTLQLAAAVDCYGAFVNTPAPESTGLKIPALLDLASHLSCPLLGLFGAEDSYPPPSEVAELQRTLEGHGKEVDFHVFDNAGHAFFAVDRPTYRPAAATEGWRLVEQFFSANLAG